MGRARSRPAGALSEAWALGELARVLDSGKPVDGVSVGIGDDAAVLEPATERLVWTIDDCVEGVHFERAWLSFADIGWRSFQAAVSDVGAMGACPWVALSSIAAPATATRGELSALAQGQGEAAAAARCPVIGGNLTQAGRWRVTTTVLGRAEQPIERVGAAPGDQLWLIGSVGRAAAGLTALQRGAARGSAGGAKATQANGRAAARRELERRSIEACVQSWRRPQALLSRGRALLSRAHALMDVSDGLRADLQKFARASEVRLCVDAARLLGAIDEPTRIACEALDLPLLETVLTGGEDYALIATGPAERRPRWARVVGKVEAGAGACLVTASGSSELAGGFDHFDSG